MRLIVAGSVAAGVLMAQAPARAANARVLGQITVTGNVAVNGRSAISGASVFSGDRIDARSNSMAALALAGGGEIVQADPGSLVVSQDGRQIAVAVRAGKVAVLSPAGAPVTVEAGGVQILPADAGGVYEVQIAGQTLWVTARKGNAEIRGANRTVQVNEGMKCEVELGAPQALAGEGTAAMRTPIVRFTLISAGVVSAGVLAALLIERKGNCQVSPSFIGSCEAGQ